MIHALLFINEINYSLIVNFQKVNYKNNFNRYQPYYFSKY